MQVCLQLLPPFPENDIIEHHCESGLVHGRQVELGRAPLGEAFAVLAGAEGAVGDAAKVEPAAARDELLAVYTNAVSGVGGHVPRGYRRKGVGVTGVL